MFRMVPPMDGGVRAASAFFPGATFAAALARVINAPMRHTVPTKVSPVISSTKVNFEWR
jgi:hypothetical protein